MYKERTGSEKEMYKCKKKEPEVKKECINVKRKKDRTRERMEESPKGTLV